MFPLACLDIAGSQLHCNLINRKANAEEVRHDLRLTAEHVVELRNR